MGKFFTGFRRALAIVVAFAVPAIALAIPASATSGPTIAETAIAVSSLDGFDNNTEDFDLLIQALITCLLYTSPSPRDQRGSRMPSSA